MDRKPWQNNGPHRAPFGSDRREGGRFSDRRDGEERGFGRRQGRSDRREFGDRRDFGDRREEGRREFGGERRGFGRDRRPAQGFGGQRRREEFGVRSGPRARALETRRFAERSDFAKSGIVKLDADLADYFENAEAVNKALRMIVEASRLVKAPTAKKAAEEAPAVTPEAAAAVFSDMDFEDDVEESTYGQALEDAQQAETAAEEEPVEAADAAEVSAAEKKAE